MELKLETDFGPVLVRASGHYIEVYTPIDHYREDLINLWDYERDIMKVKLTIDNVLNEVIETTHRAMGPFEVLDIELLDIALDELVEEDVIQRLSDMARNGLIDETGM